MRDLSKLDFETVDLLVISGSKILIEVRDLPTSVVLSSKTLLRVKNGNMKVLEEILDSPTRRIEIQIYL